MGMEGVEGGTEASTVSGPLLGSWLVHQSVNPLTLSPGLGIIMFPLRWETDSGG